MPWEFEPEVKRMQVHPGELVRTNFRAVNLSSNEIVGQAIPSVSPGMGAAYFNKTECFCFKLKPANFIIQIRPLIRQVYLEHLLSS